MAAEQNTISASKTPRAWTFRVENIPARTTPKQLVDCFVEQDRAGIEVRSLAPAVDSHNGELTATISFTAGDGSTTLEPRLFDPDSSDLSIDDDFYGLTPLNAPQEPVLAE